MNIKTFLLIFFLSFAVFNLNFTNIGETDTIPASLLPFNIFSGHGIYFDNYYNLLKNYYQNINFFQNFNGHIVSSFPLISGFLAIPIYLPFYIFMKIGGLSSVADFINLAFITEKISASLIAALSVGLFYHLIFSISKNRQISLIFAFVFAFATQTFSISSQALWQHGTANLSLIISQFYFISWINNVPKRRYALLGIGFGILSFAARNTFLLYLIPLSLLIFFRSNSLRIIYVILLAIGVLLVLSYNLYFFHYPASDYLNQVNAFDIRNIPSSLAGLFFSPSRGVVFYTPFYFLSLVSILFWRTIKKSPLSSLFLVNLFYFVFAVLLNSFWGLWWGGNSWGNRFFTDIAVPAVILSYFFYVNIKSRVARALFFSLVAYSIFIQLVGTFAYPKSYWNVYPEHVDIARERLWDFKDNPIVRSLVIGSDWSLGPRLLYWLTNKDTNKIYEGAERKCTLRKLEEQHLLGYRIVTVSFKNDSLIDWATTGQIPPFKSLNLRQVFFEKGGTSVISPITANNFPILVKSGQEIIVRTVIVPPRSDYGRLIITPAQDDQIWIDSCQLVLGNS